MSAKEILEAKRKEAALGGGDVQLEKQHARGKNTARERIDMFLDAGTFQEVGKFVTHRATGLGMEKNHPLGDGVITGWGKVDGRLVYVYAQDFTILGGSLGESHGQKITKIMDLAIENGAPLIGMNDSGGARIQEGVDSLAAYGEIFYRNTRASGVIPQISVILGPCAGGAVYSPGITDFVFMTEQNAYMFITGPEVVRAVTHEEVDFDTLGSASVHHEKSGVAHFTCADEKQLLQQVRWLLSYLPGNNLEQPPSIRPQDSAERLTSELEKIVPEEPNRPYDVHEVIDVVFDQDTFLEVQPDYAENIIVGFSRLNGKSVGIIANQPAVLAGVLDINASDKGARFIRFCDAFHIPLITFVDTPGFLPGIEQEHNGIIRHGAKMIYAYAEATVPKLALIMRKAYGGAYIVMSSKHLRSDLNYAWPNAEIAVMGPEGAVQIVFRKEIEASENPADTRTAKTQQYRDELANPYVAASRGYLDDVIFVAETRVRLINGLESLQSKRQSVPQRKHGNIPL